MNVFRAIVFILMSVPLFAQNVDILNPFSPAQIKDLEAQYESALEMYSSSLQPQVLELQAELQKAQPFAGYFNKNNTASPFTSLQATVKGTFWRNPDWIKTLDLSADQQKRMDDIFQQYRLKLIDLTAALQKEELILEPLFSGSTRPAPEAESKILTQIDRIADARAELEKANSRMLVGILQVLTPDQWGKLPTPPKWTIAPGSLKNQWPSGKD